jgi:putative flippase GtrA
MIEQQLIREMIRFITFALIGLTNAILDIIIWKSLVKYFNSNKLFTKYIHKTPLTNYSCAHAISFVITVISSYFLNKTFTFASQNSGGEQIIKFFLVSIFSWIITTTVLTFLTKEGARTNIVTLISHYEVKLKIKSKIFSNNWYLIAKILTIMISMVTNYLGYRLLVF